MNEEKPVKLSARLPKKHPANGLDTVHKQLRQHGTAIVVMQVTAPTQLRSATGIVEPVAVIEWIEGLPGAAVGSLGDIGAKLLQIARVDRTGADADTLVSRAELLADLRRHLDDDVEVSPVD